MLRWMMSAKPRRARNKPDVAKKRFTRLLIESLEDRITPAVTLAPPTILDPTTELRVDQSRYAIRGTVEAASVTTKVTAFRDSNQNGVFDAGAW